MAKKKTIAPKEQENVANSVGISPEEIVIADRKNKAIEAVNLLYSASKKSPLTFDLHLSLQESAKGLIEFIQDSK